MRVRSGSHLRQRGSVWWYRRVVPSEVRAAFGKSEVTFSLDTSSEVEAQRLEKQHDVAFEARLKAARELCDPERVAAKLAKANPMTIGYALMATPRTRDDRALVCEAMEIADKHLGPRSSLLQQFDNVLAQLTGDQIEQVGGMLLSIMQTQVARITAAPAVVSTDFAYTLEYAFDRWLRGEPASVDLGRRHLDAFAAFTKLVMLDQVRRHHVEVWRDSLKG